MTTKTKKTKPSFIFLRYRNLENLSFEDLKLLKQRVDNLIKVRIGK